MLPAWISLVSNIKSNMLSVCGSGTTTASTRHQASGRRWRGRSAARGSCSTTGCAPGRKRIAAGLPYITDAELSARLTAAKATPERAWLGEVSAVVLQQALADLNAAYRNFFASLKGERKGPKIEPPRFRSRKDRRQAIRFTANARFKVLPDGKLRLPKIGDVPVRWSRPLPSEPSSVTVIKDSAGRYFAVFVVETEPGALPETGAGDRHRPRPDPLRGPVGRPEDRLARGSCAGRRRSSSAGSGTCPASRRARSNRDKARVKVARAHARVADARRDFHHQLSTALIRDNQAVAVEDLAVNGLARTRLAKSVHDAGWSGVRGHAGVQGPAVRPGPSPGSAGSSPTSPHLLGLRGQGRPQAAARPRLECPACGARLDRDINAAVNVARAAGLAVTACGAQVRPGPRPGAAR